MHLQSICILSMQYVTINNKCKWTASAFCWIVSVIVYLRKTWRNRIPNSSPFSQSSASHFLFIEKPLQYHSPTYVFVFHVVPFPQLFLPSPLYFSHSRCMSHDQLVSSPSMSVIRLILGVENKSWGSSLTNVTVVLLLPPC